MPIRMRFDPEMETMLGRGGAFPAFVCDACGREIREVEQGVYVVPWEAYQPGADTEVLFAHQGACHQALERDRGRMGWDHLKRFIVHLAYSVNASGLLTEEHQYDDSAEP